MKRNNLETEHSCEMMKRKIKEKKKKKEKEDVITKERNNITTV